MSTSKTTRPSRPEPRAPELLGGRRFDRATFGSREEYRAARAALWAGFMSAGATLAEVAGAAGLSIQTVRRILKQEGYLGPREAGRRTPIDPLAVLRALRHPAAASLGATAKLAGVSAPAAKHVLRTLLLEPAAKRLWRARSARTARRRRRSAKAED
jgi:AraC-like DNA-binding protein